MENRESTVEVLMRVPLFRGLKRRHIDRLVRRFVQRSFKPDEAIVMQGRSGEGFFVMLSGRAEAVHQSADGTLTILNPLEPGDFFGEMALLTDTARTASVIAREPTECMVLSRWDFLGILKEDGEMAVAVLQAVAERFSRVLSTL